MANIKVGDKVKITNGVLFGTVCIVSGIIRGQGSCGSDLFLLSIPRPLSPIGIFAYCEDDEIQKVGAK